MAPITTLALLTGCSVKAICVFKTNFDCRKKDRSYTISKRSLKDGNRLYGAGGICVTWPTAP